MAKQTGIIIQEPELSSDPATPPAGYVVTYNKSDGFRYYKTAAGTVFRLLSNLFTSLGDLMYAGAGGAAARLAGNTTTTRKFLSQTGDGTNSTAPAWNALSASDIPDLSDTYQFSLFVKKVVFMAATPNFNTPTSFGIVLSNYGTPTASGVLAATNFFSSMVRLHYVSASTAASQAGTRSSQPFCCLKYGFFTANKWGVAIGQTGQRGFSGMANTTTLAEANPSTYVNVLGIGWDTGDTNMSFIHNDATGTATKEDLGSSFPVPTAADDVYQIEIKAAAGSVTYVVRRWSGQGTLVSSAPQTITTDIPADTTMLTNHTVMGNGATAIAVTIAVSFMYTHCQS